MISAATFWRPVNLSLILLFLYKLFDGTLKKMLLHLSVHGYYELNISTCNIKNELGQVEMLYVTQWPQFDDSVSFIVTGNMVEDLTFKITLRN